MLFASSTYALVVSAPGACGGRQVVTHASAFFGPQPADSGVLRTPIFAPYPAPGSQSSLPATDGAITRASSSAQLEHIVDTPAGTSNTQTYALSDACKPLQSSGHSRARGRVAIVARGNCDFSEKVIHVQRAGALGVVVVNYQNEGERLANMKLNESKVVPEPIRIPAVMIAFKDWALFAPCRAEAMNITFTAEGETSFDIDYGREALNWAMMRGMALWILCQCGVNVVRYKRRIAELRARADAIAALPVEIYSRATTTSAKNFDVTPSPATGLRPRTHSSPSSSRSHNQKPQDSSAPLTHTEDAASDDDRELENQALLAPESGTAPAESSGGPVSVISSDEDEPVCAVCLDGFEDGQRVRRLECTHLYHAACLDPWLTQSSNCCPVCKREVPNLPPPPTMLHYGSTSV